MHLRLLLGGASPPHQVIDVFPGFRVLRLTARRLSLQFSQTCLMLLHLFTHLILLFLQGSVKLLSANLLLLELAHRLLPLLDDGCLSCSLSLLRIRDPLQ